LYEDVRTLKLFIGVASTVFLISWLIQHLLYLFVIHGPQSQATAMLYMRSLGHAAATSVKTTQRKQVR
jgi:hypothetical protein